MQDQGHLWLHAFRYQSLVEIAEGTLARGGLDRRAFKYIFERCNKIQMNEKLARVHTNQVHQIKDTPHQSQKESYHKIMV